AGKAANSKAARVIAGFIAGPPHRLSVMRAARRAGWRAQLPPGMIRGRASQMANGGQPSQVLRRAPPSLRLTPLIRRAVEDYAPSPDKWGSALGAVDRSTRV